MKSRDFKNFLKLPVSELSEYRIRSCLANDLVLPKFVHESASYAQVNIQENSSYVVIIDAPYLLGSQPSALIVNSL